MTKSERAALREHWRQIVTECENRDQTITIKPANTTNDNTIFTATNLEQEATVVNNAGSELPSTGGIGTTIFYVAGIVLVLGAAAIIIARRKAEQN